MTDLLEGAARPESAAATLRTLAALESRRYARHPLFLAGVALLGWTTYLALRDLNAKNLGAGVVDANFVPAFFLGLLGVFVGHQLTRSLDRSADALAATPSDGVRRTAALCLACLVPGAVAMAWLAAMFVGLAVTPAPQSAAISTADRAAILGAGVVAAVGGPLFGVLVARWSRFPGGGLAAAVVLVGWTLLGTGGLAVGPSRLGTLLHLNAPYASWVSSDGPGAPSWVAGGSPQWYLGYLTLLCCLGVTAALYRQAVQVQRARLVRIGVPLAVLAAAALALAAAPDPSRVPL